MLSQVRQLNRESPTLRKILFGNILKMIITLINELRTDHGTNRTSAAAVVTLVTELKTDAATNKTARDKNRTLAQELIADHATNKTVIDELIATQNEMISQFGQNRIVQSAVPGAGVGLAIHGGSLEDMLTANIITISVNGAEIPIAVDTQVNISDLTAFGDTIAQNKHGTLAVFAKSDGTFDVESIKEVADYTTLLDSLASYCHSAVITAYLVAQEAVCVGFVHVQEDNSAAFAWGTDSLGGETANNYYDSGVKPSIITEIGSFAEVVSASTFSYGVGVVVLGDGTRIALTGESAIVSEVGTLISDGAVGAWVVYALANDTVIAKQLGAAYGNVATANAAVRDMLPHPYLPIIGWFTVDNGSGIDWTMGTENFDDSGVDAVFTIVGVGANHQEIGRAALGQPNQVIQNASAPTLGSPEPGAGADTVGSGTPASVAATITSVAVDDITGRVGEK